MRKDKKVVVPINFPLISEFYGSDQMATHAIGNSELPQTCFRVSKEELQLIYRDLAEIFGDKVSFIGESSDNLKEIIVEKNAKIIALEDALKLKQKEIGNMTKELKVLQEAPDEQMDPRAREVLEHFMMGLYKGKLRVSKKLLEETFKKHSIDYDPEAPATTLFGEVLMGFYGISR